MSRACSDYFVTNEVGFFGELGLMAYVQMINALDLSKRILSDYANHGYSLGWLLEECNSEEMRQRVQKLDELCLRLAKEVRQKTGLEIRAFYYDGTETSFEHDFEPGLHWVVENAVEYTPQAKPYANKDYIGLCRWDMD